MRWYSRDANGVETPLVGGGQTIQVYSLPSAGLSELNHIYQYIGTTTADYKHGYFYECVSDGQATPTYSWVMIDVQPDTPIATASVVGTVKPDNETITIDPDGTIHAIGGMIRLDNISGLEATTSGKSVSLKWSDPPDVTVSDVTLAQWAGTKVLRKLGSVPTDIDDADATLIVDNTVRNVYDSAPFIDNAVQYDAQYYYKFFPYTVDDIYTSGSAVGVQPHRTIINDVPTQHGTLTYSGSTQTPTWNNYDPDQLIIGGTVSASAVGVYTATFTPKEDYEWTDGTQDTVSATWEISRIVIEDYPTVAGDLTYTGSSQSPTWVNYNPNKMTRTGDTSGTEVGRYVTYFTPKPNYCWEDKSQATVIVSWNINNRVIASLPEQSVELSYNGTAQSPTWSNYDSDELTMSGETSGTDVGTYTTTFTPNANYAWWDGSIESKDADWEIKEAVISTVPTQQGTLTYDGTVQTAIWNNFNTDQLTVTDNTATNAGTYTASFTPKTGYKWSDGTTTAKTASWTIDKAPGSITLSTHSVTLDSSHLTATVTTSGATGTITAISGDTSIATVSYSNDTITINSMEKGGTTAITVSVAATENYNATSDTVEVISNFFVAKDWKDGANKGTDEQIAAMIAAADAGDVDLNLYWSIGDERTVHLDAMTAGNGLNASQPAQNIVLVLMDTGAASGYKDINNKAVNFVVGQKDCLSKTGRMNTTNTNSGSWNGCVLRTDLNDKYYNALPETFRLILKQFQTITALTYNGTTNQISNDYIALFAEKEIFGSATNSNINEAFALTQIDYYKTSANRIKKYNNAAQIWKERSPRRDSNSGFCAVNSSGTAYSSGANSGAGIAPFMCI